MSQKRPNVLFFFTDQQRWDSCGLHGNPLELTPNFDRLAREGTHLNYCFTPQPVCGPARGCLQTGLYATTHGTWRNGITLDAQHAQVSQIFKAGGYRTGYIGKWHLASGDPVPKHERGGYDFWLGANVLEKYTDAYDTSIWDTENNPVKLPGYRVDALTDAAIRFATQPSDQPFFLFLSFLEPHHQNHIDDYPPPIGYRERYTGRWVPSDLAALGGSTHRHLGGYWGMVKRLDEALGRIWDALYSLNMHEDTIIVFTSDHGCHFRTRNEEYKRTCHEASIRVPGMFYGPGFMGGGSRPELISLLDMPPTLLDACGLEVPAAMEGQSIMPLLRKEPISWRDSIFVQTSESSEGIGRVLRTHRWKYCVTAADFENPASPQYTEAYLYDMQSDPHELVNLIECPAHKELAASLRGRLLAHIEEVEGSRPEILQAPVGKSRLFNQRRVTEAEFAQ